MRNVALVVQEAVRVGINGDDDLSWLPIMMKNKKSDDKLVQEIWEEMGFPRRASRYWGKTSSLVGASFHPFLLVAGNNLVPRVRSVWFTCVSCCS
jgi:hypothetical protein